MYCRDTTDAATEHLPGLSKLTYYFNSYTTITDRTPEILSTMDSLERITFDTCHGLTDAGVARLARLPRLRELRVSGRGVTAAVRQAFPPTVAVHRAVAAHPSGHGRRTSASTAHRLRRSGSARGTGRRLRRSLYPAGWAGDGERRVGGLALTLLASARRRHPAAGRRPATVQRLRHADDAGKSRDCAPYTLSGPSPRQGCRRRWPRSLRAAQDLERVPPGRPRRDSGSRRGMRCRRGLLRRASTRPSRLASSARWDGLSTSRGLSSMLASVGAVAGALVAAPSAPIAGWSRAPPRAGLGSRLNQARSPRDADPE